MAAVARQHHGLTLIEVLIVMLLIGLTSAFVTLVVDARDDPSREVDRLTLALQAAADRAMIRGTPVRFELVPQGYRFSQLDVSGNWVPVTDDPLLAEHGLPTRMTIRRLTQDGQDTAGKLTFGSDIVLYQLDLELPSGLLSLVAQPTGTLRKSVPAS
jgi:type II secretion system protein H